MRLIDADVLTASVKKWLPEDPCGRVEKEMPFETDICVSMLMEIEEAETVDAEPVVHAHWDMLYEEAGAFETTRTYYYGKCSKCKRTIQAYIGNGTYSNDDMEYATELADKNFPYCHCGAKMDEEDKNETVSEAE